MQTSTKKTIKNKPKLTPTKKLSVFFNKKIQSITDLWEFYSVNYADIKAVIDKYSDCESTYKDFYEKIKLLSRGLQSLGLKQGEHVSLFSENSSKWLLADQAILFSGAVNAVRGSAAPDDELKYILEHSDSIGLVAENLLVITRLKENLENAGLKFIVCLSNEDIPDFIKENLPVYKLDEVMKFGKDFSHSPVKIKKDDLATLIYTSGTTGSPKGVMLTHGNLLSQVKAVKNRIFIDKGSLALSVLPTWHSYERTGEYFILACGCTLAYTNLINLKSDIKELKPDIFISVPRIWEAFYNGIHMELGKLPVNKQKFIQTCLKISEIYIKSKRIAENKDISNINSSLTQKVKAAFVAILLYPVHNFADKSIYHKIRLAFGGNLKQGITGGGAIARHLDDFYETAGINIINGYGLTETSPILTANSLKGNLRGSVGRALEETELKIVDPETFIPLKTPDKHTNLFSLKGLNSFNKSGLVMARGPQVMKGYYKNPKETDKILSKDGWINTGDLGWISKNGELVLTGRAKDVIVLSNGENIEPQPIEDACLKSPFIDQIILVGQDQASLGALIIPNEDSIKLWTERNNIKHHDTSEIMKKPEVQKFFKQILTECVKSRPHYRPFEKIQHLKILDEPFTVENGLMTQTMKLRKNEIQKRYEDLIKEMFK